MDLYNDLAGKQSDFECVTINDLSALNAYIESQEKYQPPKISLRIGGICSDELFPKREHYIIYRGIKESKFHLNTSLQLHWSEIQHFYPNITQKDYLRSIISLLKNNPEIQRYETLKGKPFVDVAILALMQHYGLPTPLMDWTPNIKTALNFVYDGMEPGNGEGEISDYASMYCINLYDNYELLQSSCQNFLNYAKETICASIAAVNRPVSNLEVARLNNLFDIDTMGMDFFFIDYSEDAPEVRDIFGTYLDLVNPNLEKQDGAFIINLDGEHYLEYLWNRKNDPAEEIIDDTRIKTVPILGNLELTSSHNPYATGIIPKTKISCVNIKKEVLSQWISNGGKKELYDSSEQSKVLEKAILCEYYNWLLAGDVDQDFFNQAFVGEATTIKQNIAKECLLNHINS